MAKLYFYYSTMNAGKSTAMLQASHNYNERGMRTLMFTAKLDNRGGGRVHSRIGISGPAQHFGAGDDLRAVIADAHRLEPLDCVLIDEAQFLPGVSTAASNRCPSRVAPRVTVGTLRLSELRFNPTMRTQTSQMSSF